MVGALKMLLSTDVVIPFPRAVVFSAYRDRLPDTVQHLPNIRSIRVLSREDAVGKVLLVNEWTGGGDIPAAARAIIKESMLRWNDHAAWDEQAFEVTWRTEVHAFAGAVKSGGKNRFVEVPEGTRLEVRGELTVDGSKLPGVPRLLEKSVAAVVEKFFVGQVSVNSAAMAKAITKILGSP
jgi:hypothetical protein